MTEEFVRYSALCFTYRDTPVLALGHVLGIDIIVTIIKVSIVQQTMTINTYGFTNLDNYSSGRLGPALFIVFYILGILDSQFYIIIALVMRCKLDSFYQNGTMIKNLECMKCLRILYFTIEIIFLICFRSFSLIQYFIDSEKIVKVYHGSVVWFWVSSILLYFALIAYIWLLSFTKTIDTCLLRFKQSTLYVGERYSISESKSKDVEESEENENKLDVLDYFGPKKFEASELPSIGSSKSENTEKDDEFGSYCQDPNKLNEIWREKNLKGFSLELDWMPKDETIESNDYQPYSKKKPYEFSILKLLEDQNDEKDNEIHQEKEATQIDQKNEVKIEEKEAIQIDQKNEVKSEEKEAIQIDQKNEVKSEVKDDEDMKSQKNKSRENHIKETEAIKFDSNINSETQKKTKSKRNDSKKRKDEKVKKRKVAKTKHYDKSIKEKNPKKFY